MDEREIFAQAIDIADENERMAWVADACGQDVVLLRRINELLANHDPEATFLSPPGRWPVDTTGAMDVDPDLLCVRCPQCHSPIKLANETMISDMSCPTCGSKFSLIAETEQSYQVDETQAINQFQLLDKVGAGAFGSVWSARDLQLDRLVALKLPRKNRMSREETERFFREARSAAQLKHPNIVSVLEVGRHDDRIYIASEFIRGVTLEHWMQSRQATPRESAVWCSKLADALQHAHERSVIHRDVKPANVMLDMDSQPYLMDFGLAKREAGDVTMTFDGKLLGTPAYMPPEQARGDSHAADARSDVYSLGVVLFELLAGERPFRGSTRMLLHQILAEEPPRPRKYDANIPHDLETICLKCLEKDPSKRYPTAGELRDDLNRFLNGEPVRARPIGPLVAGWRWSRRHRALVGSILASFIALASLVALAVSSTYALRLNKQNELAERNLHLAHMIEVRYEWERGFIGRVRELLDSTDEKLRGFGWGYYDRLCRRSETALALPHPDNVTKLAFSPDGKLFAIGGDACTVELWDMAQTPPALVKQMPRSHEQRVEHLTFTPLGTDLISVGNDGTSFVWRWDTDNVEELQPKIKAAANLECTADGSRVAAVGIDGSACVWKVADPESLLQIAGPPEYSPVVTLALVPGEDKQADSLATGHSDGSVRLWNYEEAELIHTFPDTVPGVRSIDVSHDGSRLAVGGAEEVCVWDLKSHAVLGRAKGPRGGVDHLILSRSGDGLAASSRADDAVMVWQVQAEGLDLFLPSGSHSGGVYMVLGIPNSDFLASTGKNDNVVKLWNFANGKQVDEFPGHKDHVYGMTTSKDGRYLASGGSERTARIWDLDGAANSVLSHGGWVWCAQFCNDGQWLVSACADGHVRLWDVASGKLLSHFEDTALGPGKNGICRAHSDSVQFVAVNPANHNQIATCGRDAAIKLWDVRTRKLITTREQAHAEGINYLSFSPDGKRLCSSSDDDFVKVWDVETMEAFPAHTHKLESDAWPVMCSPAGDVYAAGGIGTTIHLWDLDTGKLLRELSGHEDHITSLTFSKDGTTLVSTSHDESIRLWNVRTGESQGSTLIGHLGDTMSAVYSPDGRSVASASGDYTVLFWDLVSGQTETVLKGHTDHVHFLRFSPNGDVLASASWDGTVRLWRR